jgi:hypothetical protein
VRGMGGARPTHARRTAAAAPSSCRTPPAGRTTARSPARARVVRRSVRRWRQCVYVRVCARASLPVRYSR